MLLESPSGVIKEINHFTLLHDILAWSIPGTSREFNAIVDGVPAVAQYEVKNDRRVLVTYRHKFKRHVLAVRLSSHSGSGWSHNWQVSFLNANIIEFGG